MKLGLFQELLGLNRAFEKFSTDWSEWRKCATSRAI